MQANDDGTTGGLLTEYQRTDLIGPQLDIQVFDCPSGDAVAVEQMGDRARSGNPYIAAVNLLDAMSPDELEISVRINRGGD